MVKNENVVRLYRDMPQELTRAELDAATDAHVAELRVTRKTLPALQSQWAITREEAAAIQQGRAKSWLRIRHVAAFAAGMAIGQITVTAMTAHNAARLNQSAMSASIAADPAR